MRVPRVLCMSGLVWVAALVSAPSGPTLPGPAAPPQPATHSVDALKADVRQLRESLERNHPALYMFTPREEFDRLYTEADALLNRPMTSREFFQIAAPIVARIGCGHTSLNMCGDSLRCYPDRYLPLRLAVVGDRIYALRPAGGPRAGLADSTGAPRSMRRGWSDPTWRDGIPAGSEILAINGVAAGEILSRLKSVISADGGNDGWKTALLNGRTLPDDYALVFGSPDSFSIAYRPPPPSADGGAVRSSRGSTAVPSASAAARSRKATLPAISHQAVMDLLAASDKRPPTSSGDPNLDLTLDDTNGTAILTIRSFSYYRTREQFYLFVDQSFDRIRAAGCRNLVLDLRDNGGGDPFCTTHLLLYVASDSFPYFARVYPGEYAPLARAHPLARNRFTGRMYVLMNGGCFSSTGHLCALLKYHRCGTLVGTETGGTYECNDGARVDTLCATGLRLRVARTTYTVAVEGMPRGRGVAPDSVVQPAIGDILSGRDAVMERVRSMIAAASGK